jgi:hypothetical protein
MAAVLHNAVIAALHARIVLNFMGFPLPGFVCSC